MATSESKKTIDKQYIITKYMAYTLENERYPKSVYKFCKESKIKEEEFYQNFGNLEGVKNGIWDAFFNSTMTAINNNESYESLSGKDKMLTFFYSFFELLTLNRSYVLMTLNYEKMPLKNLKQLKSLRSHIKSFARELAETGNEKKPFKITKNPESIYSEGIWLQFLFLLKFWIDDQSEGFEKTDIAIEKSVTTIFDLLDNTPLNNVLDLGKFLWKEKVI